MKVIYSCIINNHDTLKDPLVFTEGWDYICFTDDPDLKSDVWTIVQLDTLLIPDGLDDVRTARYIKIMFHEMFQYDCLTIWHDASMQINCNLDWFVSTFYKEVFTTMDHPDRNCIYNEALACYKLGKDDKETISNQMDFYWAGDYPRHNGLSATGILIRENTEYNREVCKRWWTQIKNYSKRDQLSLDYVVYRYDPNRRSFKTFPFYVLMNHFILNKHNGR